METTLEITKSSSPAQQTEQVKALIEFGMKESLYCGYSVSAFDILTDLDNAGLGGKITDEHLADLAETVSFLSELMRSGEIEDPIGQY